MSILKGFKSKSDSSKKINGDSEAASIKKQQIGKVVQIFAVRHPSLSEKTHRLSSLGKYVFLASQKANKKSIKEDVEHRYGVKVAAVNITNIKGKVKQWRNRASRRPGVKKAIVSLRPGQKIDITEI